MFSALHRPSVVTALSILACHGGHAAESASTDPAVVPQPVAQLDSVVVTGDKLRRTESATTQSVASRNGRQLDESSALTIDDAIGNMANVSTTHGLAIRGIVLYGPTGGIGKTATITVDGIPQDGFGQDITNLSVWDAASVEVLRGPQSTNQGRNALAGAVVLKTRDPSDVWELRTRASVSDPRGYNLAVAGGGPLIQDVLAFRVTAEDQRDSGDATNRTLDDRRYAHADRQTLRGKLRYTPTGTDYQALLTLSETRSDDGGRWLEATTLPATDRVSLANEPTFYRNRSSTAALEQTVGGLGAEWTLLSTWGHHRYNLHADYDLSELDQGTTTARDGDLQQSHELRANFEHAVGPGVLKGVVGGYYARQIGDRLSDFVVPVAYVLNVFGQCPSQAACQARYPTDTVLRRDLGNPEIRNVALFGEFDYRIGALTFTAGLRRDHETQTQHIDSITSGNTATANGIVALLHSNGVVAPDGPQDLATHYSALLPKFGISYRFTPEWQAGLSMQRGYRTGGANYSYQRGANAYAPEFTNNYDLALKGVVAEGLLLTFNAYRIDWRDQQVNVGANSLDNYVVNAGSSRLQGLELELRGKATKTLELFGALGVSRTRFLNFVAPTANYSGNQFAYSPRQTVALGGTWKPNALALQAEVRHEGRTFSDAANTPALSNPSHVVLNGKLSYAFSSKARVYLAGQNLADRTYTTYREVTVAGRQAVILGNGRSLRAGVEAEF